VGDELSLGAEAKNKSKKRLLFHRGSSETGKIGALAAKEGGGSEKMG